MSRRIDADELPISSIDMTDVGYYVSKYGQGIPAVYLEDIKNAPTIEPEPQWIPCSEKLPESDGVYLVYAPDYRGGSSSAKEWHNGVMFAKFKHGKWSVEVGYYNRPGCVRAWMPLPTPYGEGEKS